MNELELKQCLSAHSLTKPHFRGVFARNELENLTPKNDTFIIVNTDVREDPGTHWLLLFWSKHGLPVYFDSYGYKALQKDIEACLLKKSPIYAYNMQRLQGDFSSVCGHYVAYVATQLCSGYNLVEIRRQFSSYNYNSNDKFIVTLFRKEFGYPRVLYKTDCIPMTCQCNYGNDE